MMAVASAAILFIYDIDIDLSFTYERYLTGMMAAVSAVMMSRRLPRRPKIRMTRKARMDLGEDIV